MKSAFDAVGIDLGTRNALCAYAGKADKADKNARPVMIPNRWGRTSTPSVVGWDGDWVVGEDAVRLSLRGSAPVWWDIKRKVGKDFAVLCGETRCDAKDVLTPLLRALREDAEVFLGRFVSSCALTVPACFSLLQREAMAQAAEAAGITKVRIVSEPTAAALAFGREGRFLILDFGAGTADISVVESEGGVWQVLESIGSAKVGGYDFDIALAEWLRERLGLDRMPEDDPRWRALIMEAETVKIALSSCLAYDWQPAFTDGRGLKAVRVEREELERMTRFSMRRLLHVVRKLWEKHQPERLLLVGGSSRVPLLRELLEREIARPERLSLCAEESIAAGAALYAVAGQERLLLDALSGDVGVTLDGCQRILMPSGTPAPFTAETVLVPQRSGKAELTVFQNIDDMQEERTRLGTFTLDTEAGSEVFLRCALDESGRMSLTVRHGASYDEISLISGAPSLSLPRKDDPGESRHSAGPFQDFKIQDLKIQDLKRRMVLMEPSLNPPQRDRVRFMAGKLDDLAGDAASIKKLEEVVRDLEAAFFEET